MVVYRGLPSFRANSFGRFIFVFNIFRAVPAKSEHGCLDARNRGEFAEKNFRFYDSNHG